MSENVHHNLADEKRICTESVQIQTGLALRNIYIGRSIREELLISPIREVKIWYRSFLQGLFSVFPPVCIPGLLSFIRQ